MLVCALGDLLLDVIVRLEQPLQTGGESVARTRVGAGGQAANVAAWARALGANSRFVGKRAEDAAGAVAAAELLARGVDVVGPVAAGRNGVVVSLVGADGARTMASDRGVAPELRADELDGAWFRASAWLHVAGYSLLTAPIAGAALRAAGDVRAHGGRVSVDLSSARAIETFGGERFGARLRELCPDVVFANEDEARALGGQPPAWTFVVKRGADGIAVRRHGVEERLPAAPATVVDTTGAGDALAAGFLVGGPELGLQAAARCIGRLGAMP